MSVPNTTPTPNELYNGEMKKMTDVELRVVMIITRSTLGWEMDHNTGMRKQEDWISMKQLVERTGRHRTALSAAITSCILHKWIEARDKDGGILDTPEKRANLGGKIFYRLGKVFLDKMQPLDKMNNPLRQNEQGTLRQNDTQQKKNVTKEKLTKIAEASSAFSWEDTLKKIELNGKIDAKIIGMMWRKQKVSFPSKETYFAAFHRHVRKVHKLEVYSMARIEATMDYIMRQEYITQWGLETVEKYIDNPAVGAKHIYTDYNKKPELVAFGSVNQK